MKQSFLLRFFLLCLLGSILLTGCNPKNTAQIPEKSDAEEQVDTPLEGQVISMNTEDFIRKVFDFRNASSWTYNGELPCVVDFYADWCRPCQMMAPVMEKLAEEYQGRILFYKINVDENRELTNYFQIQGIPYFLFFPMEGEPIVKMGGMNETDVRAKLEEIL